MWVQGNDYTTLRDTLVRRSKDETKYELGETGYYGGPAPDAEKLGYPRGVVPSGTRLRALDGGKRIVRCSLTTPSGTVITVHVHDNKVDATKARDYTG